MPTEPDRLQEVFLQAVEIEDPAARAALLDRLCAGDAALRARVDALLSAHAASGPLPGGPPAPPPFPPGAAPTPLLPEAVVGATIAGKYKLLEQIGEGGMGVVWMAEQRDPVRRLVALKLIKAGMDSRSVLTRFEAERQALAMMDHPSIARVLDGGVTDRGHPWFAMELVRGLPLTDYCDQRRMTVHERLTLFMEICSAVQHAHQKGIIHRDLKPTNVLVTELDGRPLPKVIDFGLAKALGGSAVLTEHTLYTAYGGAAGTPLYMAPEQVAISGMDVDTRADVYALGVLLYELLTGTTPIERRRLAEAAWDEVRRIVREEDPPLPSLRISKSDALPSLAATRHVEPTRLSGLVKGDLDWIVMKALEKDRNRRYESAASISADVGRHLANEPVMAAPPSISYRARKFVHKHRGPAIAASAVVTALALGLVGTGYMALIANQRAVGEAKARAAAELESYIVNIASAQSALENSRYPEARERLNACPIALRGWEWRHLKERAASIVVDLPGRCTLTPDGTRVVSAMSDGKIRIWGVDGKPITPPLFAGKGEIQVDFSPDGERMATLDAGGTFHLWDLDGRRKIGPIKVANQIEPNGGRGGYDGNGNSFEPTWNPDGDILLTLSTDGVAQLWDMDGLRVSEPIIAGNKCDSAYFFELDDLRIVTHSHGVVQIWDLSGRPVSKPMDAGGGGSPLSIHLSPTRQQLVTCSWQSNTQGETGSDIVRIWDLDGRKIGDLGEISGGLDMGDGGDFGPNGELFQVREGYIRIWSVTGEHVCDIAFDLDFERSLNDERLITYSKNGVVSLWELTGSKLGEFVMTEPWDADSLEVQFSDDAQLATVGSGNPPDVLDSTGARINDSLKLNDKPIDWIKLHRNYLLVVSGGMLRVWNTAVEPVSESIEVGREVYGLWCSAEHDLILTSTAQGVTAVDFAGRRRDVLIAAGEDRFLRGSFGSRVLEVRSDCFVARSGDSIVVFDREGERVGGLEVSSAWSRFPTMGLIEEIGPSWSYVLTRAQRSIQLWDERGNRLGMPIWDFDPEPRGGYSYGYGYGYGGPYFFEHRSGNDYGNGNKPRKFRKWVFIGDRLWDQRGRAVGERFRQIGYCEFSPDESMTLAGDYLNTTAGRPLGFLQPSNWDYRSNPDTGRGGYSSNWGYAHAAAVTFSSSANGKINFIQHVGERIRLARAADRFGSPVDVPRDHAERDYMLAMANSESPLKRDRPLLNWVVRIDNDGIATLVSTLNGQASRSILNSNGTVRAASISHDGQRLATGAGDDERRIRLWDMETLRELAAIRVDAGVSALEFTPADTRLIVTYDDGRVEIWDSRDHAVRQADRDARWAERQAVRPWAEAYLDSLPGGANKSHDFTEEIFESLRQRIADDPALTPTQRFVADEILLNRYDDARAAAEWE